MMPAGSRPFVYFTRLALENVRCFSERQELILTAEDERPARWTLIVGDNNVGKTTLLQCLARMRPIPGVAEDQKVDAPKPDTVEPEFATAENVGNGANRQMHIEAEMKVDQQLLQGSHAE
jgi:ABC-type branched-subunit amino acid transport system ATPase component